MTQEEKELLFIDLCARLPYGVQCEIGGLQHGPYTFTGDDVEDLIAGRTFKPYLRPMSSMTEEEKMELCITSYAPDEMRTLDEKLYVIQTNVNNASDWLNKNMFDYRGLIPMGLALEASKDMYD